MTKLLPPIHAAPQLFQSGWGRLAGTSTNILGVVAHAVPCSAHEGAQFTQGLGLLSGCQQRLGQGKPVRHRNVQLVLFNQVTDRLNIRLGAVLGGHA